MSSFSSIKITISREKTKASAQHASPNAPIKYVFDLAPAAPEPWLTTFSKLWESRKKSAPANQLPPAVASPEEIELSIQRYLIKNTPTYTGALKECVAEANEAVTKALHDASVSTQDLLADVDATVDQIELILS